MKKLESTRLKRSRSVNLRIGYAAAIFLVTMAFNWTSERPDFNNPIEDEIAPAELKIIRTYQRQEKAMPPAPEPAKTIFNKNIIETDKPNLLSDKIKTENPAPPLDSGVFIIKPPIVNMENLRPAQPKEENPIFKVVENMPLFAGCGDDNMSKDEKKKCSDRAMLSYLYKNIRYPAIARENGVEGMVVIRFVVEKEGNISGLKIVRDIGAGCGEEALRVVKNMPDWIPGKQRGRPVRVQYNLPVKFKLN
ncbi:MAG TPA: energy transducer TonB [Bacteroidetes bacterium]|nr:energy transducer TonB [Bacteroidota bacterium]